MNPATTPSLVYRSALLYESAMLLLYGRHYFARCRCVADLVPPGASVLDVCCGPARLYRRHLRDKRVRYRGLDANERFVQRLRRQGIDCRVWDVAGGEALPPADYVVMQASLYHFLPEPGPVVDRMMRAARRQVIVAEPIRNLSASGVPRLARLARRHTDAGAGGPALRFTARALDDFFARYGPSVARSFLIPGGREKVFVLNADGGTRGGPCTAAAP